MEMQCVRQKGERRDRVVRAIGKEPSCWTCYRSSLEESQIINRPVSCDHCGRKKIDGSGRKNDVQ
jgi:hypothetical protein